MSFGVQRSCFITLSHSIAVHAKIVLRLEIENHICARGQQCLHFLKMKNIYSIRHTDSSRISQGIVRNCQHSFSCPFIPNFDNASICSYHTKSHCLVAAILLMWILNEFNDTLPLGTRGVIRKTVLTGPNRAPESPDVHFCTRRVRRGAERRSTLKNAENAEHLKLAYAPHRVWRTLTAENNDAAVRRNARLQCAIFGRGGWGVLLARCK